MEYLREDNSLMSWLNKWKTHLRDKEAIFASMTALLYLGCSLVVNFYAGTYATENASSPVTDIILSNTRIYDVDGIFVYGSILFWLFITFLCIRDPNKISFTVKSIALFVLIRSVFISLTHIGPFPNQAEVESNLLSRISFGGDLFFSGHTGLPYLMALVYWNNKYLRVLFLSAAGVFGVVVLLAHMHYSIDVLSAFFITYSIFHISTRIFKPDRELFFVPQVSGGE